MTAELNTTNVPTFNIGAPALRELVDLIADRAMQGVEAATQAIAAAPVEVQPLLSELLALFKSIGFAADLTAHDTGANLSEVWGVAAT